MDTKNPVIKIFNKLAIEIYLILIIVCLLSAVNIFNVYRWHLGNVVFAIERDITNKKEATYGSEEYELYSRSLNSLREKLDNTRIAKIPLLGMDVYVTDYTHFIISICFLLLFWLYRRLVYLKQILANHLNEFDSNDLIDKAIYELFYIILPGYKRSYIYVENVYRFFLILLFALVGSNFVDIFLKQGGLKPAIVKQDGFMDFLPHLIIVHVLAAIIIYFSFQLFKKVRIELNHIRNILILIKWNNYAFFPALYSSFKKAGTPLEYKKNFIEYREYGSEPQMKLVITSKRVDRDVPTILKDEVSLVNDLQLYIPNYKKVEAENNIYNTFDEYVGRDLTGEEQMMKSFFERKITGDHDTSNEIAKDFNRAVGLSSNNLLTFDQIKELIISGRLENAIIGLKKLSIIKGNIQIEKMLTIMQREERELTKNILRGVISYDESNLRKNRMTEKILEIVEEINNGERN